MVIHDFRTREGQQRLNEHYLRLLAPPSKFQQVPDANERAAIAAIELAWNRHEESRLDLTRLPGSAVSFAAWYGALHRRHREQVEPFFDHLARQATLQDLALYIGMEEQVDGRFDDVIALAQLGMTGTMKLALAENFWDEMGGGRLEHMHTRLFSHSANHLRRYLGGVDVAALVPAQALANGNLLLMYALDRRHAARLLGALAILEHTAPFRFSRTVRGLRRLGVPQDVIHFHELHIEVDAHHGRQLFERVLQPLAARSPETLREICIGCLVRFNIALDYYASLSQTMQRLRLGAPADGAVSLEPV
ncbi:iron-containing redox enzyme family protein [Ideonella sp. YS5]|uniref:iron-containing redox enzyme family protein n=1 Tax=Ideonella sp. YS5 TaxID=3453714 RepID=UPI003EEBAC16